MTAGSPPCAAGLTVTTNQLILKTVLTISLWASGPLFQTDSSTAEHMDTVLCTGCICLKKCWKSLLVACFLSLNESVMKIHINVSDTHPGTSENLRLALTAMLVESMSL